MKAARLLLRPEGGAFPGVDRALAERDGLAREQLLNLEWRADRSSALLYRLSVDERDDRGARVEDDLDARGADDRDAGGGDDRGAREGDDGGAQEGDDREVREGADREFREGGDREAGAVVEAVLDDHAEVHHHDVVDAGSGTVYAFVHVSEREPLSELLAIVERHALLLDLPFSFTDEGVSVTVAGDAGALQRAFGEASETIDVDVEWSGGYRPESRPPLARLTDRQREALEAAYDLGFYGTPRGATHAEIADALDCAPSTANELLRRAEATLVEVVLDR